MGQIDFNTFKERLNKTNNQPQSNTNNSNGNWKPYVGYLSLKEDKDQAVVRIMVDKIEDVTIAAVHRMSVGGRMRAVNCIRNPQDNTEACPLCNAEKNLEYRAYIPLLIYERNDKGEVVVSPKIWERSPLYIDTLTNLINEYGPLSDSIFKITRNGAAGSKSTTYDISYALPSVYKPEMYPKKAELFEGYKVIGTAVVDMNYDELNSLLDGVTPERLIPKPWNGGNKDESTQKETTVETETRSTSYNPTPVSDNQPQTSTSTGYRPTPTPTSVSGMSENRPQRRYY